MSYHGYEMTSRWYGTAPAGWVRGLVNAKSDGTTLTSHDYSYDAADEVT